MGGEKSTIRRTDVQTTDLAQATAWLRELYCGHELRPGHGFHRFGLRITGNRADRLRIESVRTRGPAAVSGGPGRLFGVIQIRDGDAAAGVGRSAMTLSDRGWGLLDTSRPVQVVADDGLEVRVVLIDPVDVAGVAAEQARREGRPPGPSPEFSLTRPLDRHHAQFWNDTVDHVEYDLLPSDELMANPLIHYEACRALAAAMLICFPRSEREQPGPDGP